LQYVWHERTNIFETVCAGSNQKDSDAKSREILLLRKLPINRD